MIVKRSDYIRSVNNVLLLSLLLISIGKKKQKKRYWVRDIYHTRKEQGSFHNLLQEMRLGDPEKHFNYLRMNKETFEELLSIVGPSFNKLYHIREPISVSERLALTLRYLASGDSMVSMSYAFRISATAVTHNIRETCNAIWDKLSEKVLPKPSEALWLSIANQFEEKWQLPYCVGAIDGKHVVIQAPPYSGFTYYNYKGGNSVVLLAMCDANYRFTLVDIGGEGRHSDGGIFKNSNIGKAINSGSRQFPEPSLLGDQGNINYYIVADEAFPLSTSIMRPYPGRFLSQIKRVFNYRLCRARRVIENVFGILAARWRIYQKPIVASQPTVFAIIKATVCLHNFIMNSKNENGKINYFNSTVVDREDMNGRVIEGEWRRNRNLNLLDVRRVASNMYGRAAEMTRNKLSTYFITDGSIPFQWDK